MGDIPKIVHWGRNGESTRKKGAKLLLFVHYLTAGAWAGGELWRVHLRTGAKQVPGRSTEISGETVEPQA
jgi:hypothetical protein